MKKIIVSLTSYPKRTFFLGRVVKSIYEQTLIPDRVLLYLSKEEYTNRDELEYLHKIENEWRELGFQIKWVDENLKSHKKYYYVFQEYKDDIVITIDDDVIYKNNLIENLIIMYKKFDNCVIAGRVHLITASERRKIAPYTQWWSECTQYIGMPRMDLIATGCGGILYPPGVFDETVFNKRYIQQFSSVDDIWLKIMEIKNDIKTVLVDNEFNDNDISLGVTEGLYNEKNIENINSEKLINGLKMFNLDINQNEKIFMDGMITMDKKRDIEESIGYEALEKKVKNIINDGMVNIYGAGFIARKIIYYMEKEHAKKYINKIYVKNVETNPDYIDGIEVVSYENIFDKGVKIIIAIENESEQKKIKNQLLKIGIEDKNIIILLKEEIYVLKRIQEWYGSKDYWENRYRKGENSGAGSYGKLQKFKADVINSFVKTNNIGEVIEFGCGDGNQLLLANYPKYIGYDVSKTVIGICKEKFKNDKNKKFVYMEDDFEVSQNADLVLSLDVIYHLVEDETFITYMNRLVQASKKYICIYSSNYDCVKSQHVRCRKFSTFFDNLDGWRLKQFIPNKYPYNENDELNTSFSDFYIYEKYK